MPDPLGEFDRQPHAVARGQAAEAAAAAWLERHGYRIVERNVETPAGEIDIVADDRGTLCFIEVKAVRDTRFGPAVGRVGRAKQLRLARAAACYLAANRWSGPCRFDVLGLEPAGEEWRYDLVPDAFDAVDPW